MDWLDQKYIGLVSGQLQLFKKKTNNVYNCRCPICGDSQKKKSKARGYFIAKEGKTFFKCHNCGAGYVLGNFLKIVSPQLYTEYTGEKYAEQTNQHSTHKLINKIPDIANPAPPRFIQFSPLKNIKRISQLHPEHPAKQYVVNRQIPSNYHYKLFYAPKFCEWVNSFIPHKFSPEVRDEPRLVIPLLDQCGNLIGVQGRSFSKKGLRYITIIVDETKPKIFGLDTVNLAKKTYVFEGPIDSLFIPNSIAMAGADCEAALAKIDINRDNLVICFDNEPRNNQIVGRIEKMIDNGYRVCIWPPNIQQKDVNDMVVKSKLKPSDIKTIIDTNTFSGMHAKLQLAIWRKC